MKCLKSSKTGEIIRVSDEKAYAATSEWKFIPKSEWKAQFKKVETLRTDLGYIGLILKVLNNQKIEKYI